MDRQRMKPGDWFCSSCNAMNFASRTSCYKCSAIGSGGGLGGNGGGSGSGSSAGSGSSYRSYDDKIRMKPGDWRCSSCNAINFASRTTCYKCYRSPNSRSEYQQQKSGDWICNKCNAMNFASRAVCYKCSFDPKGLDDGPISSPPHYSTHSHGSTSPHQGGHAGGSSGSSHGGLSGSGSTHSSRATRTTSDGLWVCNKCGECNVPPPNYELKLDTKLSDDGDDHHNSHNDGYTASNYGRTDWSQSTLSGDDGSDDGDVQWRRRAY